MTTTHAICVDCGLCCDGALFSQVAVDQGEAVALQRHRLPVVSTDAGLRMSLPCGALEGPRCRIYEERPQRCRTFACELLRDVDEGRVGAGYAQTIIVEVQRLRTAIATVLPKGTRWGDARRRLATHATELSPARHRLLEQLEHLDALLDARFRQP